MALTSTEVAVLRAVVQRYVAASPANTFRSEALLEGALTLLAMPQDDRRAALAPHFASFVKDADARKATIDQQAAASKANVDEQVAAVPRVQPKVDDTAAIDAVER